MQENVKKIVAVPRLHEEFIQDFPHFSENVQRKLFVLDPTGQSKKSYPTDKFVWNTLYARQFLADLQSSTRELAKDSKNTALDRLNYENSLVPQMGREELFALRNFAGQTDSINSEAMHEEELRERAQRLLLIAYYNETLYLEFCKVNEAFSEQQANLKALLDENEHAAQFSYDADDMLVDWKILLSVFVFFCSEAEAFYMTDKKMVQEIRENASEAIVCEDYIEYRLTKEQILHYMPEYFKSFCVKKEYCFLAERKGENE